MELFSVQSPNILIIDMWMFFKCVLLIACLSLLSLPNNPMISATQWVKKGAALKNPEKVKLTDEEFARIQQEMGLQLEDAQMDLEAAQLEGDSAATEEEEEEPEPHATEDFDLNKKYNLDTYDEEEPSMADEKGKKKIQFIFSRCSAHVFKHSRAFLL